jgi:hypothetical protein
MLDPFDVFKIEENGNVSWLRSITDFECAKSYVNMVRTAGMPADFLILNQRTGQRIIIKAATGHRSSLSCAVGSSA